MGIQRITIQGQFDQNQPNVYPRQINVFAPAVVQALQALGAPQGITVKALPPKPVGGGAFTIGRAQVNVATSATPSTDRADGALVGLAAVSPAFEPILGQILAQVTGLPSALVSTSTSLDEAILTGNGGLLPPPPPTGVPALAIVSVISNLPPPALQFQVTAASAPIPAGATVVANFTFTPFSVSTGMACRFALGPPGWTNGPVAPKLGNWKLTVADTVDPDSYLTVADENTNAVLVTENGADPAPNTVCNPTSFGTFDADGANFLILDQVASTFFTLHQGIAYEAAAGQIVGGSAPIAQTGEGVCEQGSNSPMTATTGSLAFTNTSGLDVAVGTPLADLLLFGNALTEV